MFPLKDDVPSQRFPAVTLWLILVNILCFLYQLHLGETVDSFLASHGFVPARLSQGLSQGTLSLSLLTPLASSMFLHGNLLHLLSNLWMLWIFGDNVEDRMGRAAYLFFYLFCGLAAAMAQFASNPIANVPMIGASGAISGVIGAYLLLYPRARILTLVPILILFYLVEIPAYFYIGFWFLMQFLQGTVQQLTVGRVAEGGVAWWAHVGGFVAGVVFGGILAFGRGEGWRRRNT
ncbi:MAG: rhomboid family intramembrane serine protease [Thermodesulfobacteriota bacterium]